MTGPELKALREQAGVTQDQIAARAGWSHRAIVSQIENKLRVSPEAAAKYLKALSEEQASRAAV